MPKLHSIETKKTVKSLRLISSLLVCKIRSNKNKGDSQFSTIPRPCLLYLFSSKESCNETFFRSFLPNLSIMNEAIFVFGISLSVFFKAFQLFSNRFWLPYMKSFFFGIQIKIVFGYLTAFMAISAQKFIIFDVFGKDLV